jgi:putative membrane protein
MATQISNPYERFYGGDLILRDELAIDRTILANERTLLAYVRTALAFAVTGAGIMKFFDGRVVAFLGASVVALAIGIAAVGLVRYQRMSRLLCSNRRPAAARPGPAAPN